MKWLNANFSQGLGFSAVLLFGCWLTGRLYILTTAAHYYPRIWASHPECNVGVWWQVCQFLKYLVLMVLNNSLKTSPLSPLDVFFPLPSPPHPSCILPYHLLLSSLSFLYPPFLYSYMICCSSGWSFGADWWCSNLTLHCPLCISSTLPLCINSSSIPLFLHHSFFPTVMHCIHSSHLLVLLSAGWPSISSSPCPCIPFFFLPSSVWPFLPPPFLSLDRLIVFLFYRKTYKDLSLPWQH